MEKDMERTIIRKRLKGVLAMLLVFLMVVGNPLIVRADEGKTTVPSDAIFAGDLTADKPLKKGDKFWFYASGYVYIGTTDVTEDNDNDYVSVSSAYKGTQTVNLYTVKPGIQLKFNGTDDSGYELYFNATTVSPTTTSTVTAPPHSHSYEWVTTLEPTATTDGLCEYRCACGSVAASQPISYLTYIVKQILSDIKNAPANGTVTVDYDGLRCLSKVMIEALKARPDVTLIVQFTEQDVTQSFIIPAGQAPADGADWYGYYYLGALYGWQ